MATKKPDSKTENDNGGDGEQEEAPKAEPQKSGFAGIAQMARDARSTREIQAALIVLCDELERIIKK